MARHSAPHHLSSIRRQSFPSFSGDDLGDAFGFPSRSQPLRTLLQVLMSCGNHRVCAAEKKV